MCRERKVMTMAATEAQKRATIKYEKANVLQISLKFNKNTDQDIIEFLDTLTESRTGFIKKAIRKQMAKQQKKK